LRLAPYRDSQQKVQGVVVTLVNVSSLIRAEHQQQVLIAELQHRTRNLLALVQSLAAQTFEKGPALETFSTRLAALSRVQGVIAEAESDQVDLREIVSREVEALGPTLAARVTVQGPEVKLFVAHVQTLGLAVHELATNAIKYGALKVKAGHLDITWTVERNQPGESLLLLSWQESGLLEPPDATRRGFGRHLIERALAHTMRAKTEILFRQDGITCRLAIPLDADKPERRSDNS
jgi:two-component system CheB/CheR fusion protein